MPIYEYQCEACNKEMEVLQKISDSPLEICPECGEASLRKKISAVAFRLKGSGWYETDFKTGDKKNLAAGSESAGGDKGEGEKKSTSSSEATTKKDAPASGESKKSA
jgi:putative FmdB family regulatory protein